MRAIVRRFAGSACLILAAGSLWAQTVPSAPPPSATPPAGQDTASETPPTQGVPAAAASASRALSESGMTSTTFRSADGSIVTVNAGMPEASPASPPPPFTRLDSNHDHAVDKTEASDYPPLANDFDYADSNHNGKISAAEYTRWIGMK